MTTVTTTQRARRGPISPTRPGTRARTRLQPALLAAALASLVGGLVGLAVLWPPLHRQVMLSISRQPAPYTEFYFSDYGALPRLVIKGHTYPVPYTVVGHDERSKTVLVTATVTYGRHTSPLGQEKLTFGRHGRAQGSFEFTPPIRYTVYRVKLSLPGGQSIDWRAISP